MIDGITSTMDTVSVTTVMFALASSVKCVMTMVQDGKMLARYTPRSHALCCFHRDKHWGSQDRGAIHWTGVTLDSALFLDSVWLTHSVCEMLSMQEAVWREGRLSFNNEVQHTPARVNIPRSLHMFDLFCIMRV